MLPIPPQSQDFLARQGTASPDMSKYIQQAAVEIKKTAFLKMQQEQQAEREAASSQHRDAVGRLEESYRIALCRLGANYRAALERLGTDHQTALDRLTSHNQEKNAEIEARQATESNELKSAFENPAVLASMMKSPEDAPSAPQPSRKRARTAESPSPTTPASRRRHATGVSEGRSSRPEPSHSLPRRDSTRSNSIDKERSTQTLSDLDYHFCEYVLSKVPSTDYNDIHRPITESTNTQQLEVKENVDLDMVRRKLATKTYDSLADFKRDFELVVASRLPANSAGSTAGYDRRQQLLDTFNRYWQDREAWEKTRNAAVVEKR